MNTINSICSVSYLVWGLVSWLPVSLGILVLILSSRYLQMAYARRLVPSPNLAILITGATSGIGLAVAKHLYKLGFSVIAGYFSDQESGYGELLELSKQNYAGVKYGTNKNHEKPHLILISLNVRSAECITRAAEEISVFSNASGVKLYGLINNAGIAADGPLFMLNRSFINATIETNLTGTVLVTKCFLSAIVKNKGRIVNVSSGLARLPLAYNSIYCATKTAISALSRSVDQELSAHGANCICVLPGNLINSSNIILTKLKSFQQAEITDEERETYKDTIETYKKGLFSFVKQRASIDTSELKQYAEAHGLDEFELNRSSRRRQPNFLRSLRNRISRCIDGGQASPGALEQPGIVCSFEDALCLVDPPKFIYPGNWFYRNVSGPIMDYVPPMILDSMANKIQESLN